MNQPPSGEYAKAQLRRRVKARFEDLIAGVRAYAEIETPTAALGLLPILAELQTLQVGFERYSRPGK